MFVHNETIVLVHQIENIKLCSSCGATHYYTYLVLHMRVYTLAWHSFNLRPSTISNGDYTLQTDSCILDKLRVPSIQVWFSTQRSGRTPMLNTLQQSDLLHFVMPIFRCVDPGWSTLCCRAKTSATYTPCALSVK